MQRAILPIVPTRSRIAWRDAAWYALGTKFHPPVIGHWLARPYDMKKGTRGLALRGGRVA